jgi:hypothetical protein
MGTFQLHSLIKQWNFMLNLSKDYYWFLFSYHICNKRNLVTQWNLLCSKFNSCK